MKDITERYQVTFSEYVSELVGKMLTIADASFQDLEQRKAVKSLIKESVYDWSDRTHCRFFSTGGDVITIENARGGGTLKNNPPTTTAIGASDEPGADLIR